MPQYPAFTTPSFDSLSRQRNDHSQADSCAQPRSTVAQQGVKGDEIKFTLFHDNLYIEVFRSYEQLVNHQKCVILSNIHTHAAAVVAARLLQKRSIVQMVNANYLYTQQDSLSEKDHKHVKEDKQHTQVVNHIEDCYMYEAVSMEARVSTHLRDQSRRGFMGQQAKSEHGKQF